MTGTLLIIMGALYAAAHGIRLARAWHPRPVTACPPTSVTVLQPTALSRPGEVP